MQRMHLLTIFLITGSQNSFQHTMENCSVPSLTNVQITTIKWFIVSIMFPGIIRTVLLTSNLSLLISFSKTS